MNNINEIYKSNPLLCNIPTFKIIDEDLSLIGKKIFKKSCQPFKSRLRYATVKGFVVHDITQEISFTFEEDETFVECKRCKLLPSTIKVEV